MPLVYACVAPHGSEAIAKLASRAMAPKFQGTRNGLLKIAKEVGEARPDTIVIATPHNLRLWQKIAVVTAENSSGKLQASPRNSRCVTLRMKCDTGFATRLLKRTSQRKMPVVGANYGTDVGSASDMPMDWGTLVPLWFIIPQCKHKPKVVIVTPSREIPLLQNFRFGQALGELVESERRRVVFVASADQAHRHKKSGPYGFNRQAREYDRLVVRAIERNQLKSILRIPERLVRAARPDSLWQMTVLAGVLDRLETRAEVISYDVPTYFGMICASFKRGN